MDSAPVSFSEYVRLIRENRNFRRVWLAQFISETGDWFYVIAIYNLVFDLTGKAQAIGLAVVLQVLPATFIGPAAGVVNDRISRKRVMIAADLARVAIVSAMLLVRSREMVWLVYPLLLAETLMWAFFEPARSAALPNIVKKEEIFAANTITATTWSVAFASGSAIGGAVAYLFGREVVFVLNALSFVISAMLVAGMRFTEPHAAGSPPFRPRDLFDFSPVLEGARYIWNEPRLRLTVFVKGGLGFLGANWVIFPLMGERVFHLQPAYLDPHRGAVLGMSLLMGARGLGSLIGPVGSARWAGRTAGRLRTGILIGFLLGAAGYIGLSRAPTLPLACLAVVIAHAGGSMIWVFSTTLLQLFSEDRFRGRVFSADFGFCMLTIALTSYSASMAFDLGTPVRTLALWTGMGMLLPACAWAAVLRHSPSGNIR